MLENYTGPANSVGMLRHLIGEKIVAAFVQDKNKFIVMESGFALVISNNGAYWIQSKESTAKIVQRHRAIIAHQQEELGELG